MKDSAPIGLLAAMGVLQLVAVKIPAGVSALTFYGVSLLAAVVLVGIAAALWKYAVAAYAAGFVLVAAILAMVIFMLATLPPYVAPAQ